MQNAVKFTSEGGITFAVSVIRDEDRGCRPDEDNNYQQIRVLFQVIDTGIGIEPEHQNVIFHKFQQANSSISRQFGGTGLGLSICRSLSEAMGGFIALQSTPGKGSTFSVELPFVMPSSGRSSGSVHTNVVSAFTRDVAILDDLPTLTKTLKILVAEDNKINSKMIRRMLEQLGHSVQVAANGQVALDVLQSVTECDRTRAAVPDLVLMDIQMPVLDGMEATRQIRRRLLMTKTELPVVGLTASFQTADMQMYLDVGMNTCLSKPIRLETLKRTLQSFAQAA